MLRLERVSLRMDDRPVLDEVTLSVAPGELLVVHGARGAGKSALLAVAAGARAPQAGGVFVGERDIVGLQPSSLPYVRRNIAYLPADPPFLADETVLENVMLALAVRGESLPVAEAGALEALAIVGVTDVADAPVASLSAGERRLVAVARAIAGAPVVLVLDEPAPGLSLSDRRLVAAAIEAAREAGAAVLCGTAEESFADMLAASGGKRARLENGRLIGAAPTIALVPRQPLWSPAEAEAPADQDQGQGKDRDKARKGPRIVRAIG